jgi:hypothetical protein
MPEPGKSRQEIENSRVLAHVRDLLLRLRGLLDRSKPARGNSVKMQSDNEENDS